jgi:sterol desaturase/sphingolipid hydroxylase (fatty acid hydroxylase superfamily)
MLIHEVRERVRADLESPPDLRRVGTGWLSGAAALVAAVAGFFLVLCLRYPSLLTIPQVRPAYDHPAFRLGLHGLLVAAFALSLVSLVLRANKVLGFTALGLTLLAALLGGSRVEPRGELTTGLFLGLDWFVLNVALTGLLFVPLERLFARRKDQGLFRAEWREDLFYYLVSSLLVQVLTFVSMAPALAILAHTKWTAFRGWVGAQPVWLQFLEIMFLTDLVQYWVHRAFHRVPFLWNFHAVHHSARSMDWMAAARMHFAEIVVLRGLTVIPMFVLGFRDVAMHAYILVVYVHSAFVHANVGWRLAWLDRFLVTPRFHHWHHGVEREAIDVNFAIHFPLLDRLFGTHRLPDDQWPGGYGIEGNPVPRSYWAQFCYPFRRNRDAA